MTTPQFASAHRLYLAYSSADPTTIYQTDDLIDVAGDALGGGTQTINDLLVAAAPTKLQLYDTIRDVNVGGSNNSVNSTVREEARQGFSTEVIVTSSMSMTVQARYLPRDASAVLQDKGFAALLHAWASKKSIFAIDLDKAITVAGAQGVGANWTVGYSVAKPVEGIVQIDFQLAMSSKPQLVYMNAGATEFLPVTNPAA